MSSEQRLTLDEMAKLQRELAEVELLEDALEEAWSVCNEMVVGGNREWWKKRRDAIGEASNIVARFSGADESRAAIAEVEDDS